METDRWQPSVILLTASTLIALSVALFAVDTRHETDTANTEFRMCATKWAEAFSNSSTHRSNAAQIKDAADWEVKKLAIDQGLPLSDQRVRDAYGKYDKAAKRLLRIRTKPTPRFQDYCK